MSTAIGLSSRALRRSCAALFAALLLAAFAPCVLAQPAPAQPAAAAAPAAAPGSAAAVSIDTSPAGRHQLMDGFGTCIGGDWGKDAKYQQLYFDEMGCSIVRMDLTPKFVEPFSKDSYYSPWFYGNPSTLVYPPGVPIDADHAGGPDKNNCRTYTGPEDYGREYGGTKAPIAVMGPDIQENIKKMVFTEMGATAMAKAGLQRKDALGDFKLYGSIWSPAPWVKVTSGGKIGNEGATHQKEGTPWPNIWGGNFAGGKLDVSGKPLEVFNDGTGPTSSLVQFARSTAAYIKGLQDTHGLKFWGISIQNEVNFEEFYNSCTYPLSSEYIAGLKAIKAEFLKYDDLKDIRILGPEDLLGGDGWGMWQLGGGGRLTTKNLQYLHDLAADPEAMKILDLFAIHGYASNGVTSAGSDPMQWRWWAEGWQEPPAQGLPPGTKGFTAFNKRSWMTETSGEKKEWLSPTTGFPKDGAFSIAVKIHQALVTGQESGWLYWQFDDLSGRGDANSPKFNAARHFYRYIRPNAVRVDAKVSAPATLLASAYVHEANQTLTVVLINTSDAPQAVAVAVPDVPQAAAVAGVPAAPAAPAGGSAKFTTFEAYTSENNKFWQPSTPQPADGKLNLTVPGYGVVTVYAQVK